MSGHVPVMLAEVVEAMRPRDGAHYVDGTFGGGGSRQRQLLLVTVAVTAVAVVSLGLALTARK